MKGSCFPRSLYATFLPALLLFITPGCSKRLDAPLAPPPSTYNSTPGSSGSVRLLHLSHVGDYVFAPSGSFNGWTSNLDLSVGNKELTTFINSQTGITGATRWFPSGKFTYGYQFTLPDSLYDAQGNGELRMYYVYPKWIQNGGEYSTPPRLDSSVLKFDLSLHNNPNLPEDIYLYDAYTADAPGLNSYPAYRLSVFRTPKSAFPPGDPEHIKVRLINLGAKNTAGNYDQMSLCYADGSPVDPKLTGVGYQRSSDYIELPYGNYEFRLRDKSGAIINENAAPGLYMNADGTIENTRGQHYNVMHFYKPGGIYTLVATWNTYPEHYGNRYEYPGYAVIQDNTPAANPNYIKMQGVDALPGSQNIHFAIDGQTLGGLLNFGQASISGIFSIGPHKIQVLDAGGQELAEKMLDNTDPLDNLTIWTFEKDGLVQLITTSNDMSMMQLAAGLSSGYTASPPVPVVYGWTSRFLNLSDISYVTFLDSTGSFGTTSVADQEVNNPAAYQHLGIGLYPSDRPAVGFPVGFGIVNGDLKGSVIIAYDSPPGEMPGTSLQLSLDHPFIANKGLYSASNMPAAETGVYTIALTGSSKGGGGGLKLIVIKHNQ